MKYSSTLFVKLINGNALDKVMGASQFCNLKFISEVLDENSSNRKFLDGIGTVATPRVRHLLVRTGACSFTYSCERWQRSHSTQSNSDL